MANLIVYKIGRTINEVILNASKDLNIPAMDLRVNIIVNADCVLTWYVSYRDAETKETKPFMRDGKHLEFDFLKYRENFFASLLGPEVIKNYIIQYLAGKAKEHVKPITDIDGMLAVGISKDDTGAVFADVAVMPRGYLRCRDSYGDMVMMEKLDIETII